MVAGSGAWLSPGDGGRRLVAALGITVPQCWCGLCRHPREDDALCCCHLAASSLCHLQSLRHPCVASPPGQGTIKAVGSLCPCKYFLQYWQFLCVRSK